MQIAKTWRRQPSHLRLEGSQCSDCGHRTFPAATRCPVCLSAALRPYPAARTGTVRTFAVVYEAPAGYTDQVPYVTAIVHLDDDTLLPAMLTDVRPQDVRMGMRVEMVTRRITAQGAGGPIVYGYKFAPADERETP